MNIRWFISTKEGGRFMNMCEAVIRNVGEGTKAATERMCADILSESLYQVPIDTGALASTGDYIVRRRSDVKGYRYEGIIGYAGFTTTGIQGGRGSTHNGLGGRITHVREKGPVGARISSTKVNSKNGLPVSAYAAVVHEDLDMPHPRGGKAKFLEDPVRDYANDQFKRVAENYWRWSIRWVSGEGRNIYGRMVNMRMPVFTPVKLTPNQASGHGPRGGMPV